MRPLLSMFALLFLTNACFALTEDKTKVVYIKANSADLNQKTHRGVYIGEVEFDQGTTHLRADVASTEVNDKNQLIKAVAKGNTQNQAHYWTLTSPDKPPMHAFADTIRYYANKHLIVLIGNAKIEQGVNSFAAPRISYDTLHHHVVTNRVKDNRTTIVIHPGTEHG